MLNVVVVVVVFVVEYIMLLNVLFDRSLRPSMISILDIVDACAPSLHTVESNDIRDHRFGNTPVFGIGEEQYWRENSDTLHLVYHTHNHQKKKQQQQKTM